MWKKLLLTLPFLLPNLASAQSVLQAGPIAPYRVPMYVGAFGQSQAVIQDSGPASGVGINVGLSELGLNVRGTGTPPYANAGSGPFGTNNCNYDAPITNATGYHYLCFSPNAQGGGLIAYGAGGSATTLPLQLSLNGTLYSLPFSISGIVGPTTTVVGDIAGWNNTTGTLLKDIPVTGSGSVVLSASPTLTGTITAAGTVQVHLGTNENLGIRNQAAAVELAGLNDGFSVYEPLLINGLPLALNSVSGGNVGINTSSPAFLLDVNGAERIVGALTYGGVTLTSAVTGTGSMVLSTSPTLVTPNLGTPSAVVLTSGTGLPISTGLTGAGTGVLTFLATPTSANLATAVSDETGTGALVFAGSPAFTGSVLSSSPSGGVGYKVGAGGVVTQATSKATGVTLNTLSGAITLNNAALAGATIVSFTLTDSSIAATDTLVLNHISGGTIGSYTLNAAAAVGSAVIYVRNETAGSLSEAIVIEFTVIKGATS